MSNIFEEHQYQRRLLPWFLITGIWTASIWHIYKNGISTEHTIYGILIILMLLLTIALLLFLFELSIKIDKEYFMFKMFPFYWQYRKIRLNEISNATVKEYNTDRTFHGWGMGIPLNKNYKSCTVKGYKGVEISLNDGKKIFIGSSKADEMHQQLKTRELINENF